ncbi:MAG: hypothetical protein R6V01_06670 [Thermoplasmatota archaeon]
MKLHALGRDQQGKEAFAYLAVMLMVLSGLFFSYQVHLQKKHEEEESRTAEITTISSFVEEDRALLGSELYSLHDELLLDCETEVVEQVANGSIDALLQSKLSAVMSEEVEETLEGGRLKREGYRVTILNCTADPLPITADLDIPVPSTKDENATGLVNRTSKPSCVGINTSFSVEMRIENADGTIQVMENIRLQRETMTLLPMLEGRIERLAMGVRCVEFPELFSYTLGSLAQMKCLMGYGRLAYGAGGSLLSEEEVLSCADLTLALMSSSHLHGTDEGFVTNITAELEAAQGASSSDLDLSHIFNNHTGKLDPSMLAILGEGIFSEKNPPDLEMILRPLMSSLVDGLLLRMIDFIGMGDWFYTMLGGMAEVFELGKDLINSVSGSLLGMELVESNDRSASEIFWDVMGSSDLFIHDKVGLMSRELRASWEGALIQTYPMIELPDLNRTFDIYLREEGPAGELYLGDDGKVHSGTDYYDPEEEFIGYNCTVHSLEVGYDFNEIEPSFSSVMLGGEGLYRNLSLYLGTIAEGDSSAEEIMMEKGRIAIRKGIDTAIELMGSAGSDIWRNSWDGWSETSLPDLSGSRLPISEMVSLEVDPLRAVVDIFSIKIIEQLDTAGFISFLEDAGSSYRTAVITFLHEQYDTLVGKYDQLGSCMENSTDLILPDCNWELKDHRVGETTVIKDGCIAVEDPSTLDVLDQDRSIPITYGLELGEGDIGDAELDMIWREKVRDSYRMTFRRELGKGKDGREPGVMWTVFLSPEARSSSTSIISADLDIKSLSSSISVLMLEALRGVEEAFYLPLNSTSGRMLCSLPEEKNVFKPLGGVKEEIEVALSLMRLEASSVSITPSSGTYYADPIENPIPYSTIYHVRLDSRYLLDYRGRMDGINDSVHRPLDVNLSTRIEVVSMWPLAGVDYEEQGSLKERLIDVAAEALNSVAEGLEKIANDVLGDTMSSLREVPPLILDLIEGKELDLAEVSRVISNITMDASTTIRDGVRSAINNLMDMAVSKIMDWALSVLGMDSINVSLSLGPFDIHLYSDLEAVQGGSGSILALDLSFDPIGMYSHLSFSRVKNDTLDFNGTLVFDIGPLYLRAEMDPFMMRMPHMISIEGRFETEGDKPIRFSLKCPTLEEYRSCEISLGETLGVEPFIPIPILGINAVLDGGFRLRYRMPAELRPHINEVRLGGGSLLSVEIYNPRTWPIYGSTIVVEELYGNSTISWRIEDAEGTHPVLDISSTDPWSSDGAIDLSEAIRISLRDPSGVLFDDVEIEEPERGWFSRDADGYGVWRWGDGSPGSPNSFSTPGDIRTILISIAISSLKEAWEVTYEEYGLCFDMVAPFLETALDLFMERFLAVVRELVMDVMMFLDVMITDSTGTAGAGIELFFSADGEAVADFFEWLYVNLKVFIAKIGDPSGAGDYSSFPWEILHRCRVGVMFFGEIEMPEAISKMAPENVPLPDSFRLAVQGSFSISFPMLLLGMDVDGFSISLGVYIMEAPSELISLFYDVTSTGMTTNLWLLKVEIWQGD